MADKDFFKVERIKTLTVGPEGGAPAGRSRATEEWGQWKFAAGGGDLAASRAVAAVNALSSMSFNDVAVAQAGRRRRSRVRSSRPKRSTTSPTRCRIAKRKSGDDYLVNVAVAGEPPAGPGPGQGREGGKGRAEGAPRQGFRREPQAPRGAPRAREGAREVDLRRGEEGRRAALEGARGPDRKEGRQGREGRAGIPRHAGIPGMPGMPRM